MRAYEVINIGYSTNAPGIPYIEIGAPTSDSLLLLDDQLKVSRKPRAGDLVVVRCIGRPQIKLVSRVLDIDEETESSRINNGSRIIGTARLWDPLTDGEIVED